MKIAPDNTSDREIVITRVLHAPRELVWQAWTDPKHVVNWWGPRGFTTTIKEMDFRVGGAWVHTMHGPDGANYPNKSIFKEIVPFERITFSHGGGRENGNDGHGATFTATWRLAAPIAADRLRMSLRDAVMDVVGNRVSGDGKELYFNIVPGDVSSTGAT